MPQVPLELPTSSRPGRYGADGNTRLINGYAENAGREGKIPFPIYASDGLLTKVTLSGGGPMRGLLPVGSHLYAVANRQVYKIDPSFSATTIGGFSGNGPVYMAANQKSPTPQIMMVGDGVKAIIENDVITPISDTDLQAPNSVVHLNQRFVTTTAKGRAQWSALVNGTSWNSLDFVTAEYAADGLTRGFVRRGELLLFGADTIEPWYNPASGSSVFAKSGTVIERGCVNGATVAILEETAVFVADDLTVRALEGYQARKISTPSVERSIRDTANIGNLTAWTYFKDGHSFYVLSGDDFTWVFDSGSWFERESYGISRWRAQYGVKFAGLRVCGDYSSGNLYSIDDKVFNEGGENYVWSVQFPVNAYPNRVRLNSVFIDTIPGAGLNTSDPHNSDPKVMISVSKNGGKTFGVERQMSVGKVGEYGQRVKANRFGSSAEDGFIVRVSMSANVIRGISGGAINYDILKA